MSEQPLQPNKDDALTAFAAAESTAREADAAQGNEAKTIAEGGMQHYVPGAAMSHTSIGTENGVASAQVHLLQTKTGEQVLAQSSLPTEEGVVTFTSTTNPDGSAHTEVTEKNIGEDPKLSESDDPRLANTVAVNASNQVAEAAKAKIEESQTPQA